MRVPCYLFKINYLHMKKEFIIILLILNLFCSIELLARQNSFKNDSTSSLLKNSIGINVSLINTPYVKYNNYNNGYIIYNSLIFTTKPVINMHNAPASPQINMVYNRFLKHKFYISLFATYTNLSYTGKEIITGEILDGNYIKYFNNDRTLTIDVNSKVISTGLGFGKFIKLWKNIFFNPEFALSVAKPISSKYQVVYYIKDKYISEEKYEEKPKDICFFKEIRTNLGYQLYNKHTFKMGVGYYFYDQFLFESKFIPFNDLNKYKLGFNISYNYHF